MCTNDVVELSFATGTFDRCRPTDASELGVNGMRFDASRNAIRAYNDLCQHHLDYAKSPRSGVPGLVSSARRSTAETTSTDKSSQSYHK